MMKKVGAGLAGLAFAAAVACSNPVLPNKSSSSSDSGNPPKAPALSATSGGIEPNRIIELIISDSYGDETGFNLEKKTGSGDFVPLANFRAGKVALYDDWDIVMSTPYQYRVRATNSYGNSDWYTVNTAGVGPQTGAIILDASQDASIYQSYPDATNNLGYDFIQISGPETSGSWMWHGVSEGLLSFPGLPKLPSYSLGFKGAYLHLRDASSGGTYYAGFDLFATTIIDSWNESLVTWNTQPRTSYTDIVSTPISKDSSGHIHSVDMDVSGLVSKWYSGTSNYGIELYTPSSAFWDFYQKDIDPVKLEIQYLW